MKKDDKANKSSGEGWLVEVFVYVLLGVVCLGAILSFMITPKLLERYSRKSLWRVALVLLFIGLGLLSPHIFTFELTKNAFRIMTVIGIWFLGALIGMVYHLLKNAITVTKTKEITSEMIHKHQKEPFLERDFIPLLGSFKDPAKVPIGLSFPEKEPVCLDEKILLEHMTVSGATGQGKTTLMLVQLMHSLYHRKPAVVIDPKGDLVDIETLQSIATALGREDAIKVFSLSNRDYSASYNPLQVGTAQQVVAKIMAACDLDNTDNPYYANIAISALSAVIEAVHYLKMESLTIKDLVSILGLDDSYQYLLDTLNEAIKDSMGEMIFSNLKRLSNYRSDDLTGLRSALNSFASAEFFELLAEPNKESKRGCIDLQEVLNNGQVAYFQLNVNGYDALAKRVGKMILQDLKLISNRFQSGQETRNYTTAAVFIDEFGSFANEDFMGFLKMSRSAGISLRLFFQSLEDLRAVSESFEGQTIGNSVYKVIYRTPAHRDANTLAETAGTVLTTDFTFQTEFNLFGERKTGMGSQKEVFTFQVHPDDLKKLARGQAILINKDSNATTLFQTWDAKSPTFLNAIKQNLITKEVSKSLVVEVIPPAENLPAWAQRVYFVEHQGFLAALDEDEYRSYARVQRPH